MVAPTFGREKFDERGRHSLGGVGDRKPLQKQAVCSVSGRV